MNGALAVAQPVQVRGEVLEGLALPLVLALTLVRALTEALRPPLAVPPPVAEPRALKVAERLLKGDPLLLVLPLGEAVRRTEPVPHGEAVPLRLALAQALGERLGSAVRKGEDVPLPVLAPLPVPPPLPLPRPVAEAEGLPVAVAGGAALREPLPEGASLSTAPCVGLRAAVRVPVPLPCGEALAGTVSVGAMPLRVGASPLGLEAELGDVVAVGLPFALPLPSLLPVRGGVALLEAPLLLNEGKLLALGTAEPVRAATVALPPPLPVAGALAEGVPVALLVTLPSTALLPLAGGEGGALLLLEPVGCAPLPLTLALLLQSSLGVGALLRPPLAVA